MAGANGLIQRGGVWYMRRRRPTRFAAVEPRMHVQISLSTDSRREAEEKAPRAWSQLVAAWEARLHGDTAEAEARFAAAQEIAQLRGFRYISAEAVRALPVADRLARIEAIPEHPARGPDPIEAAALLGAMPEPEISVERALELYWSLARDKTIGMSADQFRRWRNPRIKAVRNFVDVVGNKPLAAITRDDFLSFRAAWLDRVEAGDVKASSANKDFIHLGDVLKTVNEQKRLGLDLPLGGLAFKPGRKAKRAAFSREWILEKLLAPGALDGMNHEARGILLLMINTGMRPSEICGLTRETIRLSDPVPHVSVEEGPDRRLKTEHAERRIPLLGVSLEAARAHPDGFPRYRARPAQISAAANKFLRENGLLETERHTLYSLRHAFEDRMLAAGIDDRVRRDLFGHSLTRERYGDGATLEHAARLLEPVALGRAGAITPRAC